MKKSHLCIEDYLDMGRRQHHLIGPWIIPEEAKQAAMYASGWQKLFGL
jgi:hypothetical protein